MKLFCFWNVVNSTREGKGEGSFYSADQFKFTKWKRKMHMGVFGASMESVYLTVLIVSGILVLFYILFGDALDGVGEGIPFLNPVLILVFLVFLSAAGYILELVQVMNSLFIFLLSAFGSFLLTTLLNLSCSSRYLQRKDPLPIVKSR